MACENAPAERLKHKLKLKGCIGQGAFGQIYKGLLDGEVVACKTMARTQAPGCETNAQVFFREAEVMKACHHNRIIAFKTLMRMPSSESKLPEPSWALVMEFARHGNLGQRVAQQMTQPGRVSYSFASALGWALDIASALEYLHMRSPAVLHRDVKSANIMLADEHGAVVAKLADFGLHVFADDSKHRTLQTMGGATVGSTAAGKAGGSNVMASVMVTDTPATTNSSSGSAGSAGHQQQQQQQQPSQVSTPAAAELEAAEKPSTARPPLQMLQGSAAVAAAAAADDHHMYSEVHDSGGSRVFVSSSHSTSGAVPSRQPPGRSSSFRRAVHHPPGEALPRIMANSAAGEPAECDADANARLFAHWRVSGSVTEGSMCSLVSQGTWATNGMATSGTDTAGSDCTDGVLDEVETVFNMTGRTGSCLYMAPEVYQNHSYNEKSDVFSFGVVLYELFAKCLVVFTELPTSSTDPEMPVRYAHKVAAGYRPSRPKSKLMTDTIWALISACWQQDPLLRPHMSEVVAVLSAALSEEVSGQLAGRKVKRNINLRSSTPGAPTHGPVASTAADAASASAPAAFATSAKVAQQSPGTASSSSSSSKAKAAGQQAGCDEGPQATAASQGCGCVIS